MTDRAAQPFVSVVIPTRNGMPLVEVCLRRVLGQRTPWPFEVIVIDSSSTDGTWELLERLDVRRLRINPHEFNHGATRNAGARLARGEFLVFVVQDSIPADERWLVNLVSAAAQPKVAGAYSRQLPRRESNPITQYTVVGSTPAGEQREIKVLPGGLSLADLEPEQQFCLALFQNNSSCIRRDVWSAFPFATVPYGEDIEWGRRVIDAGYAIVYEPSSVVFHSHDRSPLYALKRGYADHFQAADLFGMVMIPSLSLAARHAAWETLHASRFIMGSRGSAYLKFRCLLLTPIFVGLRTAGQYLGPVFSKWLPRYQWLARVDVLLRIGV